MLSSTTLRNTPSLTSVLIGYDKLLDIPALLDSFHGRQIAVVGDLMLDEYLWGHIERISPEAPVPILNVVSKSSTLGGAGNVVENLRAFGIEVATFGIVGDDEDGLRVRSLLSSHGANIDGVITIRDRKTTRKVRLMSLEHGRQVFRFDEEATAPVHPESEQIIVALIRQMKAGIHAIICSDYLKGVLSPAILAETFAVANRLSIRTITGPKDSRPDKYRGADILMPNARELIQLSNHGYRAQLPLETAARSLLDNLGLRALVLTRGGDGMSLFEHSTSGLRRVDIPTTARSVYDVTGAGDTAIAAFSAAVASGSNLELATYFSNITAGIKVGKRGTASVTVQEILGAQRP